MRKLHKELEKQRELLYRLAFQGLILDGNRTPSDAVIAQSRKVDKLISAIEKENNPPSALCGGHLPLRGR